jgi:hypothetical protein
MMKVATMTTTRTVADYRASDKCLIWVRHGGVRGRGNLGLGHKSISSHESDVAIGIPFFSSG